MTGAPVGFSGPVRMKEKIPILADRDIQHMANAVAGANAADAHLTGVNLRRDFQVDLFADLRNADRRRSLPAVQRHPGLAPRDRGGPRLQAGHEVFRGPGRQVPRRRRAAQADHHGLLRHRREPDHRRAGRNQPRQGRHHLAGVAGPVRSAVGAGQGARRAVDEGGPASCTTSSRPPGIDVLLDDRDCRAGVKFKDADLIGVPLRVVIGERGLKEGKLEIKWRWDKEVEKIDLEGAAETLAELIRAERAATEPGFVRAADRIYSSCSACRDARGTEFPIRAAKNRRRIDETRTYYN